MRNHVGQVGVILATSFLVTFAMPFVATAKPNGPSQWSNLDKVPPGEEIVITGRDGRVFRRNMVAANETQLVTLDLNRVPPGRATSLALFITREAPGAVAGPGGWEPGNVGVQSGRWESRNISVQAGVIRQDGKEVVDLRPALDTFNSQDVALVVRPRKPGSARATTLATIVGLALGGGIASGMATGIQCQPNCGGVEAAAWTVGVGAPVGAGLAAYYGTRRPEKVIYKSPTPAPSPGIDDAMWARLRQALPPSLRKPR